LIKKNSSQLFWHTPDCASIACRKRYRWIYVGECIWLPPTAVLTRVDAWHRCLSWSFVVKAMTLGIVLHCFMWHVNNHFRVDAFQNPFLKSYSFFLYKWQNLLVNWFIAWLIDLFYFISNQFISLQMYQYDRLIYYNDERKAHLWNINSSNFMNKHCKTKAWINVDSACIAIVDSYISCVETALVCLNPSCFNRKKILLRIVLRKLNNIEKTKHSIFA